MILGLPGPASPAPPRKVIPGQDVLSVVRPHFGRTSGLTTNPSENLTAQGDDCRFGRDVSQVVWIAQALIRRPAGSSPPAQGDRNHLGAQRPTCCSRNFLLTSM